MESAQDRGLLFGAIGQGALYDKLSAVIRSGRVGSAYLLAGPGGAGKLSFALEFAAAMNCLSPRSSGLACGTCDACLKSRSLTHGNVRLVFALPGVDQGRSEADPVSLLKDKQFEDVKDTLDRFRADPYQGLTVPGANMILIGSIRHLRKELRLKSGEEGWQFVIIALVESANTVSLNSLLKILEEPPPRTTFVLTTEANDSLPATIRSRCQILRFSPVQDSELMEYLSGKGVGEEKARLITRLSNGDIRKLRDYLDRDPSLDNESFLKLWRAIMRVDMAILTQWIADTGPIFKSDRAAFEDLFRKILYWFRDAQVLSSGLNSSVIILKQYASELKAFTDHYPGLDYYRLIRETQQVIELAPRNIYIHLLLGQWLASVQSQLFKARRRLS